ncbi:MAG: ABC transporter permease [Chloroflexi bacterium RBG_13_51_18]|nr:MAG: ABC transporter permease [Chloroflexi bacterium RBG_13_51_18]
MAERIGISSVNEAPPHVNELRRFFRVFLGRGLVMFGLVVTLIFLVLAIFAPQIAPYDPLERNLSEALQQPNAKHLLGTDAIGRDTLSRLIHGARISMIVGVLVVSIAGGFGVILGAIAGYFGGIVGAVIMRLMDTLMTIPMMILALAISALLGGGLKNVVIALGFALIPGYARLMAAQVLVAKETDYVLAEHAIGASNARILIRHIVPNCFSPILVLITMMMGTTILAEAGLSFIGIGITPPTPAWGSMVTDGRNYLLSNPMLSIAPGVAIMLLVFSFNMVGDGLRDALDPRLRGVI